MKKCDHNKYPVIFDYGFIDGNGGSYGENGEALFIDSGIIGGSVICANCFSVRLFTPDVESNKQKWNHKSLLKK